MFLCRLLCLFILVSSCNNAITKNNYEAELEYKITSLLGEGALWNYKTNELYWVDIVGKQFNIYSPVTQSNTSYNLPTMIGTVVPVNANHVLVALADGVYKLNLKTKSLDRFCDSKLSAQENRFNDGKCDPNGNLWVGTINLDIPFASKLYRINHKGQSKVILDSVTNSNGIVWSKDSKTMFYIDSPSKQIKAFDYDIKTSSISNQRVLVEVSDELGILDGMTIDENDNLWVGLWNGSAVAHFNTKTGELIKKINVPAKNVTSCAFGGKELDILYITTSSLGMTDEEKILYPDAGSIFKITPGVKGVETQHFISN